MKIEKPTRWEKIRRWLGFKPIVTGLLLEANKDGDFHWDGISLTKKAMEDAIEGYRKKGKGVFTHKVSPELFEVIRKGKQVSVSVEGMTVKNKLFDHRIKNKRAQILTLSSSDGTEVWEDLLTWADKAHSATCPVCLHQDTLYNFKWKVANDKSRK